MKYTITIICIMIFMIWGIIASSSNSYWIEIGPTWDQMLNPCDYEECKETHNE